MNENQQLPGQPIQKKPPARKNPPFMLYFLITVILIFSLTFAGIQLKGYIDKKFPQKNETAVQDTSSNEDTSTKVARIIFNLAEILAIIIIIIIVLMKLTNKKHQ